MKEGKRDKHTITIDNEVVVTVVLVTLTDTSKHETSDGVLKIVGKREREEGKWDEWGDLYGNCSPQSSPNLL